MVKLIRLDTKMLVSSLLIIEFFLKL